MKHVDLIADGSCLSHEGPAGGHASSAIKVRTSTDRRRTHVRRTTRWNYRLSDGPSCVAGAVRSIGVHRLKYVQEGWAGLVPKWKANRWRNSRGRPLPNQRLWLELGSAAYDIASSGVGLRAMATTRTTIAVTGSPARRPERRSQRNTYPYI